MISLDAVRTLKAEMFRDALEIVEKKGRDYNRVQQKNGDTLHNLRVCALNDTVRSPQKGILVRLSDKMQRLNSLENPAENPANSEESVRDTILDCHNYLDYYYAFYEEERAKLKNAK